MIDVLNGYLSASEDLRRAMPGLEIKDKKKLSSEQKGVPLPETEFWDRLGDDASANGVGGIVTECKSWEELEIEEARIQEEKKEEFVDYELSLENQSFISSLFVPGGEEEGIRPVN